MRALKHLILAASLLIPAIPHAQEAVAQGGVGSGSAVAAQNLALEMRLTQEAAQNAAQGVIIQQLQSDLGDTRNELENLKSEIINLTGGVSQLTSTVSNSLNSGNEMKISGYQIVTTNNAAARCPTGKKILGGGCSGTCELTASLSSTWDGNFGHIPTTNITSAVAGYPSNNSYSCGCGSGPRSSSYTAYAICANVE